MLEPRVRDALTARLAAEPAIVAAWIFGSVARGTDRAASDLDVAILTSRSPSHDLRDLWLDLRSDLCQIAGREVDLVVVDEAPADLVHRVLRDGILVVETDRSARVRFEVGARNRYFDMTPIWNEYRRVRAKASA